MGTWDINHNQRVLHTSTRSARAGWWDCVRVSVRRSRKPYICNSFLNFNALNTITTQKWEGNLFFPGTSLSKVFTSPVFPLWEHHERSPVLCLHKKWQIALPDSVWIHPPSKAIVSAHGFHLTWLIVLTFVPVHWNWGHSNDLPVKYPLILGGRIINEVIRQTCELRIIKNTFQLFFTCLFSPSSALFCFSRFHVNDKCPCVSTAGAP